MNQTQADVLRSLSEAAAGKSHAEKVWRAAVREALAGRAPIEHVATTGRLTIAETLSMVNEMQREYMAAR